MCRLEGCGSTKHYAKGYCRIHYNQHNKGTAVKLHNVECGVSRCKGVAPRSMLCRKHQILRARYGLTNEELIAVVGDETCDICGVRRLDEGAPYHIDHDHRCCDKAQGICGKCIRGLLCHSCNARLGVVENEPWVSQARKYLTS